MNLGIGIYRNFGFEVLFDAAIFKFKFEFEYEYEFEHEYEHDKNRCFLVDSQEDRYGFDLIRT